MFLWLPTPEMALRRVAARVEAGGHDVPEDTVRRRFIAGQRNFFDLYRPLTESWAVYDSTDITSPELIACGSGIEIIEIGHEDVWRKIQETHDHDD